MVIGIKLIFAEWGRSFKMSICQNDLTDCKNCTGSVTPPGYCLYAETMTICLGSFTRALAMKGFSGVQLFYEENSIVRGVVQLFCDYTTNMSGVIFAANSTTRTMTVRTKYACLSYPLNDCTKIVDPTSGAYYNLSPIIGRQLRYDQNLVSLCQNTLDCPGGCFDPVGYCVNLTFRGYCLANFYQAIGLEDDQGVELLYESYGGSGHIPVRIRLLCDPTIELSEPTMEYQYSMTAKSKYACAGPLESFIYNSTHHNNDSNNNIV
jgi:hypothetical protein